MGEHMRLEILDWPATVWVRTPSPLLAVLIKTVAIRSWTLERVAGMARSE
jgi:hypothetical protein